MAEPETLPDPLYTAGIDVGSSAVKVAVVAERAGAEPELLASAGERIRRREPLRVVEGLLEQALAEAGLAREGLTYVATTGEGEGIPFRTGHFYGMTAHARGGLFLEPEARVVIDIGALHARAMRIDGRGKVLAHRMTSQCASGSGQFLESIGRYLGVTLDELGPRSLEAKSPEACSSICAVLAETDVINMVSRGIAIPDIVKGIHESMAGRYVRLLAFVGGGGVALVTGGLAADVGLMAAIREAAARQGLDLAVRSHPRSALAGAIGAALWGAFRVRRLAERGQIWQGVA